MKRSIRRHLSINIRGVRRSRGDSFARQTAYICRTRNFNPYTGRWHDYRRRGPAEAVGLVGWDGTVEELIEEVVATEKRKDSVEGRGVIVAIPDELLAHERLRLVKKCAQYISRKFKVACMYAIHRPSEKGDQRNWHAHLLFGSREVIGGKALGRKTRELDSRKIGGDQVEAFRAWWTNETNYALRQAGFDGNCEHRSFLRLGVEAVPGRHNGERQTAIARRLNRGIRPLPIPSMGQWIQAQAEPETGVPALALHSNSSLLDGLGASTPKPQRPETSPGPAIDDGGPVPSGRPGLPTPKPPPEPEGPSR